MTKPKQYSRAKARWMAVAAFWVSQVIVGELLAIIVCCLGGPSDANVAYAIVLVSVVLLGPFSIGFFALVACVGFVVPLLLFVPLPTCRTKRLYWISGITGILCLGAFSLLDWIIGDWINNSLLIVIVSTVISTAIFLVARRFIWFPPVPSPTNN